MVEPVEGAALLRLDTDAGLGENGSASEVDVAHVDHEGHDSSPAPQFRAALKVA